MADETKLRGAMGLAMKAGKCAAGDYVCEKLIRSGQARLALLDTDASPNTKKRYRGMCARTGIPLLEIKDAGSPIGKPGRMIAAVTDERFAQMIRAAYETVRHENDTGVE